MALVKTIDTVVVDEPRHQDFYNRQARLKEVWTLADVSDDVWYDICEAVELKGFSPEVWVENTGANALTDLQILHSDVDGDWVKALDINASGFILGTTPIPTTLASTLKAFVKFSQLREGFIKVQAKALAAAKTNTKVSVLRESPPR